jgi:hypothetical protein
MLMGSKQYMPPFYPLDTNFPSFPSSPDSETLGNQSSPSFPGLADMRSEAGIFNYGEKANDPSREERKLEVGSRSQFSLV